MRRLAILVVVFLIAVGVGVLALVFLSQKSIVSLPGGPKSEIEVSLKDFLNDYQVNPIAADEKYKDHVIVTVGKIYNIVEVQGKPLVIISIPGIYIPFTERGAVYCFFKDKQEVKMLRIEDEIVFKGQNIGISDVTEWVRGITFKDCSLVEVRR
jgi:hypothetical protein